MRASRLLTVLMTLQLRGRCTARALAEELGVSLRTVYRDIDELSAAGVPVYSERGRNGGVALLGDFRTELTGLTQGESEALLLAGIPAAAADLGLAGQASSARLKLLAAMPSSSAPAAQRMAERFHLDPLDWYRHPVVPAHLQVVAGCVWENRCLLLDYDSWTRRSQAQVEPLGLVLKAGRWYLVAQSRGRRRIYRLDSIRSAQAAAEHFSRPKNFNLADVWQGQVEAFEASLRRLPVTLRVAPSSHDRLDRLGDRIAQAIRCAAPGADGWRRVEVDMESVEHAAGLLLGFADEIEVLAPRVLREEMLCRAARIEALYRDRS
ncbi:helix-turn-helix transcriptional regulator [Pseudomarimonas salicorniae]|uniref:WYL domain-containing protein n=1 Tax=Pseudomarimonas salicorniae TaxID=2933270 RepID=A0ABT0GJF9_9GAMM|nr:WYL domain-containing protein [Lysobacter sp. CAU 1642]MCK7594663.1 WYL domain-containing protein [Lysobacter sp. CAU 1642]